MGEGVVTAQGQKGAHCTVVLFDPSQRLLGHVGDAGVAMSDALDQVLNGGLRRGGKESGETSCALLLVRLKWWWRGLKGGGEGEADGEEHEHEQLQSWWWP